MMSYPSASRKESFGRLPSRIEAAFWIAEKKRARLRGNPTEEAFARLAFEHRMQQTEDLDSR
jgi:hypothetical protein